MGKEDKRMSRRAYDWDEILANVEAALAGGTEPTFRALGGL